MSGLRAATTFAAAPTAPRVIIRSRRLSLIMIGVRTQSSMGVWSNIRASTRTFPLIRRMPVAATCAARSSRPPVGPGGQHRTRARVRLAMVERGEGDRALRGVTSAHGQVPACHQDEVTAQRACLLPLACQRAGISFVDAAASSTTSSSTSSTWTRSACTRQSKPSPTPGRDRRAPSTTYWTAWTVPVSPRPRPSYADSRAHRVSRWRPGREVYKP